MTDHRGLKDDGLAPGRAAESNGTDSNGQLATPALTPISEHGDRGHVGSGALEDFGKNYGAAGMNGHGRGISASVRDETTTGIAERLTELPDEDMARTPKQRDTTMLSPRTAQAEKMLKLSPRQIQDLTSSPGSLPVRAATPIDEDIPPLPPSGLGIEDLTALTPTLNRANGHKAATVSSATGAGILDIIPPVEKALPAVSATPGAVQNGRLGKATRSVSSPMMQRKQSQSRGTRPPPLKIEDAPPSAPASGSSSLRPTPHPDTSAPSPMPANIPIPPLSLPTYLQLELSSSRPSPLYIHRPVSSDFPYESSKVKFERLLNFLILPPQLEQVLVFGALACLDSWLYTFTILPLRFLKALVMVVQWSARSAVKEVKDLSAFVWEGVGRLWERRKQGPESRRPSINGDTPSRRSSETDIRHQGPLKPILQLRTGTAPTRDRLRTRSGFRHRRSRSTPSALLPNHKADLLQGLLIILGCVMLMSFDASRMYHSIRGQAAIKLYVIYNVLEVFDRLFSALGQDVLECLFSKETLERNPNGRSKVIRPLWMFVLALLYVVVHSGALFYQVVTLNVAVNSYSNALLTLLMSNQFVEIKGTVFKKFEKENLFQLTCADVVERFQLWLMLLIIALRNIVEVGGLTISSTSFFSATASATSGPATANATAGTIFKSGIIPKAFTLLPAPRWIGEVLGPFLIVLGSEMLVDWLKHAYITKFNNVKPNIYGRFLDVLAKDYYSHAFADQNLTKRLGLPVIPLSCLFIRASMQTYHMFVATHVPMPVPLSSATAVSLDNEAAATSPATMKALEQIDHIFRRALGRSSFGAASGASSSIFTRWTVDDIIALATMAFFFLALYLILLALKLVLGIILLNFARRRYVGMKERERQAYANPEGKRVGGWGVVEVGEEKRRWIYEDDEKGLHSLREKEAKGRAKEAKEGMVGKEHGLERVERYSMAAKRIW